MGVRLQFLNLILTASLNYLEGLVSTIIPVYNRAIFLRQAVESVLHQTYRPIELILVDDGSTDNTAKAIADLVASHPSEIRSVRIANSGPGCAREQGRLLANGEFIQYLDSDDELLPCKFEVQVKALRENPDCGVAYGKTRLVDFEGKVLKAPFKLSGVAIDYLFPSLLVDRWWNTLTPLYRREVCDAVGPWPPMWMAEDWMYDARVGALGTKLVFCDEFVADYRTHSDPRLTGQLSPRALINFCQLVPELHRCAIAAGVTSDCSEMRHLARWAFSLCRLSAQSGEIALARDCLDTAVAATSPNANSLDLRTYKWLSNILGWKRVGIWSSRARKMVGRSVGSGTQLQSWMK